MTAPLTPFRVYFDAVAGKVPTPVLVTAATPRAAETAALRRHPSRTVAKIKRDKSAPHPEPIEGRGAAPVALFGQRLCACGYANHDLRKRCRSCGSDLPSPNQSDDTPTTGDHP